MITPRTCSLLLARLQLVLGERGSVLLAGPRDGMDAEVLARGVVDVSSGAARLLDLRDGAEPGPRERLASELSDTGGLAVVCGGGVLDTPEAVMALGMVQAVVLVARKGATLRDDIERARAEIERTPARLIGSVLLD